MSPKGRGKLLGAERLYPAGQQLSMTISKWQPKSGRSEFEIGYGSTSPHMKELPQYCSPYDD
jgi:hypothetical protein